jgi:hypothetical protein
MRDSSEKPTVAEASDGLAADSDRQANARGCWAAKKKLPEILLTALFIILNLY